MSFLVDDTPDPPCMVSHVQTFVRSKCMDMSTPLRLVANTYTVCLEGWLHTHHGKEYISNMSPPQDTVSFRAFGGGYLMEHVIGRDFTTDFNIFTNDPLNVLKIYRHFTVASTITDITVFLT